MRCVKKNGPEGPLSRSPDEPPAYCVREVPVSGFCVVSVEELAGAEVEELFGADALPFRLTSVELDEEPGVTAPFTVVEDDEDPGTTAIPGVTSVVVVLLERASGTLGVHPAGCGFSESMHFGSMRSLLMLVMVSARATPKAASIEAAKRLILNVLRFICITS
jgi:hypothetical protein